MIEFRSVMGNTYAFDEEVGLFIPFSPTMRAVAEECSTKKVVHRETIIEKLGKDFDEEDIAFCYDWVQKWKKISSQSNNVPINLSNRVLPTSSFKVYLLRMGLKQLTLGVTEDCNLRCKYCVYSDNYDYTRDHSKKNMTYPIAKKAIDYYYSLLEEGRRYNPKRKPAVSFFGGEPLINFDLIRKCVDHIERTYTTFDTNYNLTTNGSLLDEDKVNWLMQNNFSILVSIDGPENEHDRNRVYRDGKGTFKKVMKNVAKLMDANYKKISVISTFGLESDMFKRDKFFSRIEIPPLTTISEISRVPGCKYYDKFSEEDYSAFIKQIGMARRCYLDEVRDRMQKGRKQSVFDILFGRGSIQAIYGILPLFQPSSIMPLTGACVPGEKIFVDVDGNFHICERVNNTNPIGNINEGLDFEIISKFVSDYLRHMDKCPSCKLRRSCSKCYAQFMTKEGFLYSSEVCKDVEYSQLNAFATAFTIGEIDPIYIDDANARLKTEE